VAQGLEHIFLQKDEEIGGAQYIKTTLSYRFHTQEDG
jgi:hypothetical protein